MSGTGPVRPDEIGGSGGLSPRTRWGDGNSIWVASEYIGQTCTLDQYLTAPIGLCSGTRTALANWDTRISKLTEAPEEPMGTA